MAPGDTTVGSRPDGNASMGDDRAFAEHPARFVNKAPVPIAKPTAAWINRPTPKAEPECRPQSQQAGATEPNVRSGGRACPRDRFRTTALDPERSFACTVNRPGVA
jgi:hypothetical protein